MAVDSQLEAFRMMLRLALLLAIVAIASARSTRRPYTTRRYATTRRPFTTRRPGAPLEAFTDRTGKKFWRDRGSFGSKDLTVYEATRPSGDWFLLGQRAQPNYNGLEGASLNSFRQSRVRGTELSRPEAFTFVWDDQGGTTVTDVSTWRMICARGFASVGDVFALGNRNTKVPPQLFDKFRCVRNDLVEPCFSGGKIWDNKGAWGKYRISVWGANPRSSSIGGYFYAHNQHDVRPPVTNYCLRRNSYKEI